MSRLAPLWAESNVRRGLLHAQTGQTKSASLQSVGFGARYGIDRYLDLRFDYGWQLSKPPGATHASNLAELSVTSAY